MSVFTTDTRKILKTERGNTLDTIVAILNGLSDGTRGWLVDAGITPILAACGMRVFEDGTVVAGAATDTLAALVAYVYAVVLDGDYLNDYLGHMPYALRPTVQVFGQDVAYVFGWLRDSDSRLWYVATLDAVSIARMYILQVLATFGK